MNPPPPLATNPVCPLSFWVDIGPVLLLSTGIPLFLVLFYFYRIHPLLERHRARKWLRLHRPTMRRLLILNYLMGSLDRKLGACRHCDAGRLQLWEHDRRLLVLRCSFCKRNYTLTHQSFPEVRFLLRYMPSLMVVMLRIRKNPDDVLGRRLLEQCRPFTTFLRRDRNKHKGKSG